MKIGGYYIKGECVCIDQNGNEALKAEIMYITPEIAEKMLANNPNNRNIRKARVKAVSDNMKNGSWKINGESIVLKANGELADGQHRLSAVVSSGIPVLAVVVTVPNEEAEYYDIGLTRSVSDIIKFAEDDKLKDFNDNRLIGAISFLLKYKSSSRKDGRALSKPLIIQEMERNIDVLEWYMGTPHASSRGKAGIGMSPVIAALMIAYKSGYPVEKLNEFCKVLATGISETKYHVPIIKLRDWLMGGSKALSDGASRQIEAFSRTVYALRAFEKNNEKALCKAATVDYYKWEVEE